MTWISLFPADNGPFYRLSLREPDFLPIGSESRKRPFLAQTEAYLIDSLPAALVSCSWLGLVMRRSYTIGASATGPLPVSCFFGTGFGCQHRLYIKTPPGSYSRRVFLYPLEDDILPLNRSRQVSLRLPAWEAWAGFSLSVAGAGRAFNSNECISCSFINACCQYADVSLVSS